MILKGKKVPLDKEIAYLKSYIELQKLRFGDDTRITTEIEVADNGHHSIEPMLLIPFVENAFKHGIGWIEDPFIYIKLTVAENRLTFTVKNKFSANGVTDSKDNNSGIGLANVSSRLKLLYPDQHILAVQQENDIFATTLTLQLR